MKKVLIYTYKQSNYGAVLQAYALQKYLRSTYDVDARIVDFTTETHLQNNRLVKTSGSLLENLYFSFFNLLHSKELKRRITRTQGFKDDYFIQTERYSTVDELINHNPPADVYITGSDQVFSPTSIYLPVYYLGFDKGKGIKVAYAPSFGISKFTSEMTERIRPYLKDFDYLSCRETVGADYLSSIVNKSVPTVCDPTLLLDQSSWREVAKSPNYSSSYILVYEINGGDNIIRFAKRLKKEIDLPIVCITSKSHKQYKVDLIVRDAGPAEFVGWFMNATFIVTDSFHGTVFSWMFEKDFYYFLAYEATSSRVKTLLKHLNCEDRIVKKEEIDSFNLSSCKPYMKESLRLISESKHYLDRVFNHAE